MKHMQVTRNANLEKQNFIDCHCHLLPGLDDGAADMAEAVAMARSLAGSGITEVCCTPHLIRGCHEPDSQRMATALSELQERLDDLGIGLRLHAGREYYLDEFLLDLTQDPVTVAGGECVLVEIPGNGITGMVKDTLYRLRSTGYIPLIAHPERCGLLEFPAAPKRGLANWLRGRNAKGESPCLVDYLKGLDCLFQGNIFSFAGIYGERVRRRAVRFLESGLYSCLGSDAHGVRNLDQWLDKGLREIELIAGKEGLHALLSGPPVGKGLQPPAPCRSSSRRARCRCARTRTTGPSGRSR